MKNLILLCFIWLLAGCASPEEKRNEMLQKAITGFADSIITAKGKGGMHLDSTKILYVDSITKHEYLVSLQEKNLDKIETLSDLFDTMHDLWESQMSLARLSYTYSERDKYIEEASTSLSEMESTNEKRKILLSKIDSIGIELNMADSIKLYGYLVKSATYISGLEKNQADTSIFLVTLDNRVYFYN